MAELPRKLGPYELLSLIGTGGMAEVYRARVVENGRERFVAIKQLSEDLSRDPSLVAMFLDEARLARQLSHPSIVALESFGSDEAGRAYMALEYIDGRDLRWVLAMAAQARYWLPVEFSLSVVRELCRALAYAHRATGPDGEPLQLVHRDVSHSNVFLARTGRVKLADFGIARARGRTSRTRTGMVKGKLGYLSPEQVRAEALDGRADVFAAAVVLWELLTQRRMFVGETEFKTMLAVCRDERVPPSKFRPGLPPLIDRLVLKGVAIEREQRYASADEMERAITEVARQLDVDLGARIIAEVVQYLTEIERLQSPTESIPPVPAPEPIHESPDPSGDVEQQDPFRSATVSPTPAVSFLPGAGDPSDVFMRPGAELDGETTQETELVVEESAILLIQPADTSSPRGATGPILVGSIVRRAAVANLAFDGATIEIARGARKERFETFSALLEGTRDGDAVHDILTIDGKHSLSVLELLQLTETIRPDRGDTLGPAPWTKASGLESVGTIGELALSGFSGRLSAARETDERHAEFDGGFLSSVSSTRPADQLLVALVAEAAPQDRRAIPDVLREIAKRRISLVQAALEVLHVPRESFDKIRTNVSTHVLAEMISLEDKLLRRRARKTAPGRGSSTTRGRLALLLPACGIAWSEEAVMSAIVPFLQRRIAIMSGLPPMVQTLQLRQSSAPILEALHPGRSLAEVLAALPPGPEVERTAKRLLLIFLATGALRLR
ncbi:MAG: serine/threonine-protein kinase [Myxococcota bacterium]